MNLALNNNMAFPMDQVLLSDAYCENALAKEIDYLTSFNIDKLLAGFRETAGLDMKGEVRYDGWENMLIGGHTMGHYLTALSQSYVNPGVTDKETIRELIDKCIDGLLECQNHSKGKPGFLFGATMLDKTQVELQFDYIEQNKQDIIKEAWVPWYTLHKILAGVLDVYKLTGNQKALTIAKGIGDWTYNRASSWDEATHTTVINIEFGGMNDALYELYALTDDEKYAKAAHYFDPIDLYEKILAAPVNALNNTHANTTIPKFIGALNRYVTSKDKASEERYLEYAKAFWTMVITNHTYITGGNSEWEHFGEDKILDAERTNCNNETCNVYNMLKLSRMLFNITGEVKYLDYYENAFINQILSSQNPETGMTTYFQAMATGYFKTYGERFDKFWCCVGSGMENFTKLNDSIYFKKDNNVIVNMYFSSTLNLPEHNLSIVQTADLPVNNTVSFTFDSKENNGETYDINLMLHLPSWLKKIPVVTLNGKEIDVTYQDGFAVIAGPFKSGDAVDVRFDLIVTAHPLPDNKNALGFKYGPVVLSANLGTKDMVTTQTGVIVTIPAEKIVEKESFELPKNVSIDSFIENINDYLKLNEKKTAFEFQGIKDCDLKFTPHFRRYKERYGIYFFFC